MVTMFRRCVVSALACVVTLTIDRVVSSQGRPPDLNIGEAANLLLPGSGELRGRAAARVGKGLFDRSRVYARHQVVHLYPMTAYMRAWHARYQGDFVSGALSLAEDASRLTARAVTDADGHFRFRGLRAGSYFLATSVSYEAELYAREATDRVRVDFNYFTGVATAAPIYSSRRIRADLRHDIYRLVQVREGDVLDLGDIR